MKMSTSRRCLAGAALLALLTGCDRGDAKASKQAPAIPPPTVIVAEVPQRTVQVSADFVARTEAVPTVEIRARISGVLEKVQFREGSEVKQGQVLFVIQQDEYKAALQSARAQLAKADADLTRAKDVSVIDRARAQLDQAKAELGKNQADVARYRPLVKEQAIPQQDLDTALSREEAARAGVQAAEAALKDSILSQRTAIQLAEAADLRLVKRVPGLGRGEVPRDRAPMLDLILADGTVFPQKGRPIFVDRAIDLKTGTIQVRAEFPNPQWVLRPGQFGRVRAVTEEVPDAILVPQVAVQDLQGAKTVLVVGEGDKVALRTVTVREPYQQFYIVSAGLKPGERVIVEGLQKARPGMQVKPELKAAVDGKPAPAQSPAAPPPGATPGTKPKS